MKSLTRKTIDQSLFFYGTTVSLVLTFTAIQNLTTTLNLITMILFLPVSLYFFARLIQKINHGFHLFINYDHPKSLRYFGPFSLNAFLNQTDYFFLISLLLIAITITLTLFKISSQINP